MLRRLTKIMDLSKGMTVHASPFRGDNGGRDIGNHILKPRVLETKRHVTLPSEIIVLIQPWYLANSSTKLILNVGEKSSKRLHGCNCRGPMVGRGLGGRDVCMHTSRGTVGKSTRST